MTATADTITKTHAKTKTRVKRTKTTKVKGKAAAAVSKHTGREPSIRIGGMTLTELAAATNGAISRNYLSRLASRKDREPGPAVVAILAQTLKWTPERVLATFGKGQTPTAVARRARKD